MTTRIDINAIKRTSDLPQNDRFFDFYDGERLVAHLCLPHRLDAPGTLPAITYYNDKREIISRRDSRTPVVTIRNAYREQLKAQAVAAFEAGACVTKPEPVKAKPATKAQLKAQQDEAFAALLTEAYKAADAAQAGMVEDMRALDCGFAWVEIEPANHPFVLWCKARIKAETLDSAARKYGSKGYPRGWQFWKPGNFYGQSIGIHEAGAKAFRDVLALGAGMGGAQVRACSRYD